jgi:putative phage-type endonuclease
MFTLEELKARQKGIGASEIAIVLGCSPFSNRYELYHEKIAEDPTQLKSYLDAEPHIKWGRRLEDPIAEEYAERAGAYLDKCGTIIHNEHPIFYATPDRIVTLSDGLKIGLEIKNVTDPASFRLWGRSGSSEIPEYYYAQVAQSMFVLDFERWDVAALLGGGDFRIYTFHRYHEFDDIIMQEGYDFWEKHVLKRVAPDPNEEFTSAKARDFLRRLYPTVETTEIRLPETIMKWVEIRNESKALAKQYAEAASIAEAHIMHHMGKHSKGILPDGSYFLRSIVNKKTYTVEAHEELRFTYKEK